MMLENLLHAARAGTNRKTVPAASSDMMPEERLRQATWRGDIAAMQRLLAHDLSLMDTRYACGNRPLHIAAASGRTEAVRLLLALGADVNARNVCGVTPLHLAILNSASDLVERLLRAGADVNACAEQGATPLTLARMQGRRDIVERLRAAGACE